MKTRSFVYVSALLFACGAPTGCLAANCPPLNSTLTSLVSQLQTLQYYVQCGSMSFNINTQLQCPDNQGITNPSTCYGQYSLPTRRGGLPTLTQLDDDEAILTVGSLPPPVFYYGYYTFVYSRINPTVSPAAYVSIQAPVGPAMNQRNADPGLHAQLGSQFGGNFQLFGQPAMIVTTANTITQSDIISALSSVYGTRLTGNITYVEKLPVDLMQLGSSGGADQLLTSIRVSPITTSPGQFDPAAVAYMQKPPVAVFRVSPIVPRTHVASATYHLADDPLPATKVAPGQVWEQTLFSKLGVTNASQALGTIVSNVVSDRAAKGKTLLSLTKAFSGSVSQQGRSCIAAFQNGVAQAQQSGTQLVVTNAMLCKDASPDAAYFGFTQPFSFPSGGEIVWVGVNHGTLGSATYSSVALQTPAQYGSSLSQKDLNGSAAPFLRGVPAAASSDFYVVSFNEACATGSSNCLYAPANTTLFLLERIYLAPRTATMPDYTDIIPSEWLVFN